jgi:Glycosyl transferases group 1
MSAGVPVVATTVGGVPEQIIDGVTGILVPVRSPHALAEAIMTLTRDADRRKAIGREGRKRIELEFPIVNSVSELARAYERLEGKCTNREKNRRDLYSHSLMDGVHGVLSAMTLQRCKLALPGLKGTRSENWTCRE